MKHYLDEDLFNSMLELKEKDEPGYLAWQVILCDDTLCPVLRGEKIDIYYRGFKAFSFTGDGITRNLDDFKNELHTYDVPKVIPEEKFVEYLPYMKQNIDLWMGAGDKSPYQREFMQLIMRENNSKEAGNLSDYFIIDMEHQYKKNGSTHDLTGLIMERGKRQEKIYRLSVIEVKYLDRAFTGPAGIQADIADYVRLIKEKNLLNDYKKDISEMFYQSRKLGLLQGVRNKYERICISDERPELLLALISRNTNNERNNMGKEVQSLKTILKSSLNEYGDMLDEVYLAYTAEIGFGLYADRKTGIKAFCEMLD